MYFSNNPLFPEIRLPLFIKAGIASVILCLCIMISGCSAHYYRVTEPISGKTYYTDEIKKTEGDGVELKDARTGETVTIQNSEVREINKYEFETGRLYSGNVLP